MEEQRLKQIVQQLKKDLQQAKEKKCVKEEMSVKLTVQQENEVHRKELDSVKQMVQQLEKDVQQNQNARLLEELCLKQIVPWLEKDLQQEKELHHKERGEWHQKESEHLQDHVPRR